MRTRTTRSASVLLCWPRRLVSASYKPFPPFPPFPPALTPSTSSSNNLGWRSFVSTARQLALIDDARINGENKKSPFAELDNSWVCEEPILEDQYQEGWAVEQQGHGQSTPSGPLKLRPFQLDCVKSVLDALQSGTSRIGVSAPTGSGKTAIFTALIKSLPPIVHPHRASPATRVLIIVHTAELAQQAANTVKSWWPDLSVEIEQGPLEASGMADCTVATYQTLMALGYRRLQKFKPNHYKGIIVDEAHHSAAKTYLEILSYFDSHVTATFNSETPSSSYELFAPTREVASFDSALASLELDPLPAPLPTPAKYDNTNRVRIPIIGFTATFERADDLSLGRIYETISWHADWLQMIRGGWLSALRITTVPLGTLVDLDSIKAKGPGGEFATKDLEAIMDNLAVNRLLRQAWVEKASDCRSTLVFVGSVSHIISLVNHFRVLGIDARGLHAKTDIEERRELLRDFKAGNFPVLVNCGILTEGADFPGIDCVMIARPTASRNLFMQMLGRGLRLSPDTGKTNCLILDFVGSSKKHNLVSAPRLFGLDPLTALDQHTSSQLHKMGEEEEATRVLAELAEAEKAVPPGAHLVDQSDMQYRDYVSVFDLISQRDARSVRELSELNWVTCGKSHVLSLIGKQSVKIVTSHKAGFGKSGFTALLYEHSAYYGPPTPITSHQDFATVVSRADSYVSHRFKDELHLLPRAVPWRSAVATEAQLNFIAEKLKVTIDDEIPGAWVDKVGMVPLSSLRKGEAGDAITRLLHGGKGALAEHSKAERRVKREGRSALKRGRGLRFSV